MTGAPRSRISPSVSIRHCRSPSGCPTVPTLSRPGRLTKLPALDSDSPYPSISGSRAAAKNSAMSLDSGAAPEHRMRMLPPSRARSLVNTSRSATARWAARVGGTRCPPSSSSTARFPARTAQLKIFALVPPSAVAVLTTTL